MLDRFIKRRQPESSLPEPGSDQELVDRVRQHLTDLKSIAAELKQRGVHITLRHSERFRFTNVAPDELSFVEAKRETTETF